MAKKRFPINRMGVYKITNLINGKIYIGSSFDMGKRSQQFKEKHYKKIKQFTKDGVYIKTWDSISECANYLSMDCSSITKVCRGKLKSSNNFKFSYV